MRCNLAVVCVAYLPEWEPLANALAQVVKSSVSEQQAKSDICNAVADRKIAVRVVVDKRHQLDGNRTFSGGNVGVPPRLSATDFDWTESRPLMPWPIGPMPGQHYAWVRGWEDRPISLIELSTADVRDVLSNNAKTSGPHAHHASPHKPGPKPKLLNRIKGEMLRDLQEGRYSRTEFRDMLQKNLSEMYKASRNTVRKAREQVMSELNSDK
jgi:hypothetical protein